MAAHVVITDSSFRTTKVKVTPSSYMTDVIGDACTKWKLNSSNYVLKSKAKPVDLSLTFRQTGLSSGAKLDLVVGSKSPSVVSIALQIPDPSGTGQRLTDKVPSDTTLWRILRKFESSGEKNLNFTARGVTEVLNGSSGAGRIFYEMPVLNVLGRELSTFGDLQKTLAQLGVNSGSALIKLNYKKTDQPLEEAMAEIGQYFKDEDKAESNTAVSQAEPVSQVGVATDSPASSAQAKSLGEDQEMEDQPADVGGVVGPTSEVIPTEPPAQEEPLLGPNQRPISVFAAPTSTVIQAALQPHNEADFEPTVAHAKLHQSRLLNGSQNKRLLSDKEAEQAEQEKAARLASEKSVEIKLRFPDQTHTVASFRSDETAADFYDWVRAVIVAENQPFKLVWQNRGPQTVPKDEKGLKRKLIKDLGLSGRVLVNFVWEDTANDAARNASTLKPEYLEKAKEIAVPKIEEVATKDEETPLALDKGKGKESSDGGGGKGKGMPKWFKGVGKK